MTKRMNVICMTVACAAATGLAVTIGLHAPHAALSAVGFVVAALGAAMTILWAMEV